jgi:hypothetical protein
MAAAFLSNPVWATGVGRFPDARRAGAIGASVDRRSRSVSRRMSIHRRDDVAEAREV